MNFIGFADMVRGKIEANNPKASSLSQMEDEIRRGLKELVQRGSNEPMVKR